MSRPDDESQTDSAWREIVAHYGERARLGQDDVAPAAEAPRASSYDDAVADAAAAEVDAAMRPWSEVADVDRFQPPAPPPVPLPRSWQRGLAWAGVFLAPLIGISLAIFDVYVASLVGWGLVAWFVGGFVYLIVTMSPTPREPWDDGSRV